MGAVLQADSQWEVTEGYVGCARLVIPLTNLNLEPCSLELEEALLSIRPRQPGVANPGIDGSSPAADTSTETIFSGGFFDSEDGKRVEHDLSLDSITAGVTRIAGGIETILQKLRVQVTAQIGRKGQDTISL